MCHHQVSNRSAKGHHEVGSSTGIGQHQVISGATAMQHWNQQLGSCCVEKNFAHILKHNYKPSRLMYMWWLMLHLNNIIIYNIYKFCTAKLIITVLNFYTLNRAQYNMTKMYMLICFWRDTLSLCHTYSFHH